MFMKVLRIFYVNLFEKPSSRSETPSWSSKSWTLPGEAGGDSLVEAEEEAILTVQTDVNSLNTRHYLTQFADSSLNIVI